MSVGKGPTHERFEPTTSRCAACHSTVHGDKHTTEDCLQNGDFEIPFVFLVVVVVCLFVCLHLSALIVSPIFFFILLFHMHGGLCF